MVMRLLILAEEEPNWFIAGLMDILKTWWGWIVSLIDTLVKPLVLGFIDNMPDISPVTTGVIDILKQVNYWLPVTEAIWAIEVYIGFIISFIALKYVIKLFLPGVG